MFRQAQLHLEIRNLLQHLRLRQMPGEAADIVRDDGVAVELAEAVRQQSRHRTVDLRSERLERRRQVAAAFAPPAGGAAPEQLFAVPGALLHLEAFAR